jgi:2,4-dienoyl-CoA reductase-like NADH-dependent reductase (Old Yellow Enzyme family)
LLERMAKDEFDLVAVGRALIANPDWANRVRRGDSSALRSFTKEHLFTLL